MQSVVHSKRIMTLMTRHLMTTSLRHWRSYTGCRCSSASNSNCACWCTRSTSGNARHISLNWWARQQKTVVNLVCVQQAQASAATRNPDCIQNSLNVPSLSLDLQNGTVLN